jgi:hyperosmotically inducible periplasmic protein
MILQNRSVGTTAMGILLLITALAACDRKEQEPTVGQQVDKVIEQVDEKTNDTKEEMKDKVEDAKKATSTAAEKTAAAMTDTAITTGVKAKLAGDSELKSLDISVTTDAGHVRMQGTAPNESSRVRAKQLAAQVQGVVDVDNQLQIESK